MLWLRKVILSVPAIYAPIISRKNHSSGMLSIAISILISRFSLLAGLIIRATLVSLTKTSSLLCSFQWLVQALGSVRVRLLPPVACNLRFSIQYIYTKLLIITRVL